MIEPILDEWRYEIKLSVPEFGLPIVKSIIQVNENAFSTSYPPRVVNNLYFDTYNMQCLEDSYEGVNERQKVRLRWYDNNDLSTDKVFEIKRKKNNLNSKIKFHIPQAIDLLAGDTWPVVMSRLLNWLPINIRHQIGPDCMPVLINKYNREYFEDPTGKVRVTIDSAQNVYDQRFCAIPNLYRSAFRHPDAVIEIKGPPDSYEKIKQVSSELPIRVSRNSKYSLGYEAIEFR